MDLEKHIGIAVGNHRLQLYDAANLFQQAWSNDLVYTEGENRSHVYFVVLESSCELNEDQKSYRSFCRSPSPKIARF